MWKVYSSSLQTVLLLNSSSSISLLLSLVTEVPLQEDTLMRTIIIGLSNELPLTAPETLEIADSLVRRVAAVKVPSAWMQGSQSGQLIMVDVIHYMESQPLGSDFESVILFLMWIPIKFVKYTCTCEASEKQCKMS